MVLVECLQCLVRGPPGGAKILDVHDAWEQSVHLDAKLVDGLREARVGTG